MNKQFKYLLQHRGKRRKGDTAQLAAQLAPLEERKVADSSKGGETTKQSGAIVVDKDTLKLPREVMEGRGKRFLEVEPVVLVILVVMLTFIAFIAWQISQMPAE
jgi:hypothetical protein